MDVLYLKKEAAVKTCIDQGEKIFSSYQMQVIKSKFYTAITFDRDSEEYKKRIDELYNYAFEHFYMNLDKAKKKEKSEKKEERKNFIHKYIIDKDKNMMDRVASFNDKVPLPKKYRDNSSDLKDINDIFDVKEKLYMTDDITSILNDDMLDITKYVKTMVAHSFLNYAAKDALKIRNPRYVDARKEMFDYIDNALNDNIVGERFLEGIFDNEDLLRMAMWEVEPEYFDKLSEKYILIKDEIKKKKKSDPAMIQKINIIEDSVTDIIDDNLIRELSKMNEYSKTL